MRRGLEPTIVDCYDEKEAKGITKLRDKYRQEKQEVYVYDKTIFNFFVLLISSFAFFEPFKDSEKILNSFIADTKCVIVYRDNDNVNYIPIHSIFFITIDEDDFEILTNAYDEEEVKRVSFPLKKYDITQDEKGNIIVRSKN